MSDPQTPLVEFVLFAIRDFAYRSRLPPEMVRMHPDEYNDFAHEVARRMKMDAPRAGAIKLEGCPVMASGEVDKGDLIVSHIDRVEGPETYSITRES